jgi:uncharacterized protein
MKYLLLLALVAVAWWAWQKRRERPARPSRNTPREPERMVACAHCGVNVPQSESVGEDGEHFCCEAHRQAAHAGRGR